MKSDNYFNSDEFKKKLQQYREMLQSGERVYFDADTLLDIAEYFDATHRHDLARDCANYAHHLHPDEALPLIYMARLSLDDGKLDQAKQMASAVIEKECYEYYLLHGEILLYQLDINKANAFFNQALTKIEESDFSDFLTDVAAIFLDYEYPLRALKWLEKIDGGSYDARCQLLEAECYLNLEEYEKVYELLKHILDNNPYDIQAWILQAETQYSHAHYEEAIESCDFALAIDPNNEHALKIKGCASEDLHEEEKAHACYNKYLDIDPENALIQLLDGNCLLTLNRPKEALIRLKKAGMLMQQQNNNLDKTFIPLAKAYAQVGDLTNAFEYIEKAAHAGYPHFDTDIVKIEIMLQHDMKYEATAQLSSMLHNPDLSDENYMKIAQLTFTYQLYDFSLTLFKHISKNVDYQKECYPYMAYIYRQKHNSDEYLRYISMACVMSPRTTKRLFSSIYPETDVKFYPEMALKEKWQSSLSDQNDSSEKKD